MAPLRLCRAGGATFPLGVMLYDMYSPGIYMCRVPSVIVNSSSPMETQQLRCDSDIDGAQAPRERYRVRSSALPHSLSTYTPGSCSSLIRHACDVYFFPLWLVHTLVLELVFAGPHYISFKRTGAVPPSSRAANLGPQLQTTGMLL